MSRLTKIDKYGYVGLIDEDEILTAYMYWYESRMRADLLDNAFEKLKRYEDLEEQGLLLRLPCKVGDVIWFDTYKRGERMGVQSHKVEEVRVRFLIERDYAEPYTEIPDYEFGKTVFLTREEAEQKLKEMEG